MDTKEMTQEQISALADGELAADHLDCVLAALRQPAGNADWEIYHQIGDVLRSDDMALSLSSGFSARMAERLRQEPVIVAPATELRGPRHASGGRVVANGPAFAFSARSVRRWAIPGAVAAAVAAVAFVATPQLMVALNGGGTDASTAPSMIASSGVRAVPVASTGGVGPAQGAVVATSVPEGVVLRDPRIDDYLLAHQRFSPSVFSSAQYARSAAFATDSNK